MSKIKKIVVIVLLLIFTIVPFSVSAAEVVNGEVNINNVYGDVNLKNLRINVYNKNNDLYYEIGTFAINESYFSVFNNPLVNARAQLNGFKISQGASNITFGLAELPSTNFKYHIEFNIYMPYSNSAYYRTPELSGAYFYYYKDSENLLTQGKVSVAETVVYNSQRQYGLHFEMDTECTENGYFQVWFNFQAQESDVFNFLFTEVEVSALDKSQLLEKEEATKTGNESVDELGGAIPNESDGFIDSIGNLISSMGYSGRESCWTLPQIYIPKIGNIIPRYDLTAEHEID